MQADVMRQDPRLARRLVVSLIGGLRLECLGEGPVRFVGKRAPAMIAFLAMRPAMSASRAKLCDLLWDHSDAALNNLRQTLLVARRALAEESLDVLVTTRDFVALRQETIDCDVHRLEHALAADDVTLLEAAASLCDGAFLEGFSIGSDSFDEWASAERSRVHELIVAAHDRLARRASGKARHHFVRRLLAIDPLREASYRLSMEALVEQGERDQALRMYETCRAVLRKELNVEPSKETRALRDAISALGSNAPPSPDAKPTPVDIRPSIAVLHFSTLSSDGHEDYLSKALSRDLVTALSEHRDYVVFGAPPSGDAAAPEARTPPGVRFLISGSVQGFAGQFRVSVHLIESARGEIVWAQRFDGASDDLIRFQDTITQAVALAVRLELQLIAYSIHDRTPAGAQDVRRLTNQALTHYFRMTRESLSVAARLASEALALDPGNARAARTLSVSSSVGVVFGSIRKAPDTVSRALSLAQFAVESVPDDVVSRIVLSYALLHADRREEAIGELNHALSLNPHYPSAHGDLAEILALQGRTDEALTSVAESTRLGATDPTAFWRTNSAAIAKFAANDDLGALELARKVGRAKPDFLLASVYWAAAAAATNNLDEATRAVERCLSGIPDLTLANLSRRLAPRYAQEHHQSKLLDMLRKAGLPDG